MQIDKNTLRLQIKIERKNIKDKQNKDLSITKNYLKIFDSDNALVYISKNGEADTFEIIKKLIESGKKTAAPVSYENGEMQFYEISDLNNLKLNERFNVYEPDISVCKRANLSDYTICIVPALCYDIRGYRLGYGKGYYDRFLKGKNIKSVGLIYSQFIFDSIITDDHDQKVAYIVSENGVIKIAD